MLNEWVRKGVEVGSLYGFAFGTGATLFAWMIRQVWGLFRKLSQS